MDTDTIEERSVSDLQEILKRLGGWPVLEGDDWKGQEDFRWYELSIKAAKEGFDTDRILSIGTLSGLYTDRHCNIVIRYRHGPQELCQENFVV